MKGAEHLAAMRRAGAVPDTVDVRDERPGWLCAEWARRFPRHAFVAIGRDERLDLLDLRCVIGLPVQVSSSNPKRLGELLRRLRREQPARLIGTLFDDNPTSPQLLAVYDSEGVATWHSC